MTNHQPAARQRFVSVNGLKLHFLEWGAPESPPIVLLHGGSANAHWWDFFAPLLADRYRLLALDLRGHGDSGWHPEGQYGVDSHADDVRTFIDTLGLDPVCLIGHSFGGLVGTTLACRSGDRLSALVLVDSRLLVSERGTRFMEALGKLPHPMYSSVDQAVLRFRLLPTSSSAPPAALAHIARHVVRQVEGGWTLKFDRRTLAATEPCDLTEKLAEIARPVLLVRGSDSDWVSSEVAAEWAALAPDSRIVEVAGAHHHVMLDQPEALATAVHGFLGSIAAG